jgi:hypothetical protein
MNSLSAILKEVALQDRRASGLKAGDLVEDLL